MKALKDNREYTITEQEVDRYRDQGYLIFDADGTILTPELVDVEKAALEAERDQMAETIKALEAERDQMAETIKALEAERDQMAETIKAMEAEAAKKKPAAK